MKSIKNRIYWQVRRQVLDQVNDYVEHLAKKQVWDDVNQQVSYPVLGQVARGVKDEFS